MNWLALIQPFIALSLLRVGPQDLPSSNVLLRLSAAAFCAVGIFANFMWLTLPIAFVATLVEAAILVGFVTLMLRFRGLDERVLQTLTAMFGYSAVLGFLLLPISAWIVSAQQAQVFTPMHQIAIISLLAWDTVIRAHIFRHAFDHTMGVGVVMSLVYFFANQAIVQAIIRSFHTLAPAAQ